MQQDHAKLVQMADKAKKLTTELTKLIGHMSDTAITASQKLHAMMEQAGIESEEEMGQRLETFAMPLAQVRAELRERDLPCGGKALRLRTAVAAFTGS